MKKKQEAKYLDNEWDEMDARLKAFLATGDQEQLHKFRVQIKKVRAMLSLFESTSRQYGLLKDFKPVRKIFKYAGTIRDAHISLELAKRYEVKNKQFEIGQQKIIEEGTAEFKLKGKEFIKKIKESRTEIKKQLTPVDNSSIADYYKKQLEFVAENMEPLWFTEDIHTSRKIMKILIYNYKLAEKALKGVYNLNINYLDKLQGSIGEWHDNVIASQLFASPELNDHHVVAIIRKKNAGIKRRIITLAKDFLIKATTGGETINSDKIKTTTKVKATTNGN